jgi:hypothetical protein
MHAWASIYHLPHVRSVSCHSIGVSRWHRFLLSCFLQDLEIFQYFSSYKVREFTSPERDFFGGIWSSNRAISVPTTRWQLFCLHATCKNVIVW